MNITPMDLMEGRRIHIYVVGIETRRTSFGNGTSQAEDKVRVSLEVPDAEKPADLDKDVYH